jgi:hypothetical protein
MGHRIVIPRPGDAQLAYWTSAVRNPRPDAFVYVVQAQGDSPIKVGTATDVRVRIKDLQTGNPRPLRLRAVLPGSYDLEHVLHKELAGYRMVGEWFDDQPSIEWFLERVNDLAEEMYVKYRLEDRVPSFVEFEPYKKFAPDFWPHSGVVRPFETPPIGRLSSARKPPVDTSPQREAERERRASEELAWVMDPERLKHDDD